jgi:hypothetical protein
MYDEKLTKEAANRSLVIYNEATMRTLFAPNNLAEMKTLTEGLGKNIVNKYGHPFVGFVDAFTLITCNSLDYPFT